MQFNLTGMKNLFLYPSRFKHVIGSGQFGTVFKGVWLSAHKGQVEVAIKTLKESSGEEDRVKFFQEAIIMGQFKHPNVVEVYGMVTKDMPVSLPSNHMKPMHKQAFILQMLIVLELLCKGDLKKHLLKMKTW